MEGPLERPHEVPIASDQRIDRVNVVGLRRPARTLSADEREVSDLRSLGHRFVGQVPVGAEHGVRRHDRHDL